MSQENVDVVRTLVPDHDVDVADMVRGLRDPQMAAATADELDHLFDPDFEAVAIYSSTVYRGPYGLRDLWLDWLEPWASYFIEIEEMVDDGDRVIVQSHDRGRRQGTNAEVELRGASVWTFRKGRLLRAEFHPTGEAREAVGLRE